MSTVDSRKSELEHPLDGLRDGGFLENRQSHLSEIESTISHRGTDSPFRGAGSDEVSVTAEA